MQLKKYTGLKASYSLGKYIDNIYNRKEFISRIYKELLQMRKVVRHFTDYIQMVTKHILDLTSKKL